MTALLTAELGYVVVFCAIALLLMVRAARLLRQEPDPRLPWPWLAAFAVGQGLSEALDMAAYGLVLSDGPALQAVLLIIKVGAWVALFEFGRRGVRIGGRAGLGLWVYLPLPALAALGAMFGAVNELDVACRYALALPSGLLAGAALWQASRSAGRTQRAGLRLAAVALVAYAAAAGFCIPRLVRVLCAPAVMTGIWLRFGDGRSGAAHGGPLHRWLFPAALVLLVALGWFASGWQGETADAEMGLGLLAASGAGAENVDGVSLTDIEYTPPAREDFASQRLRAGIPVLVGTFLGVVVFVTIGVLAQRSWR